MANYYVDDSASPGGDGSLATPWKTIGAAIAAVGSGHVIRVFPGTYTEVVKFRVDNVTLTAHDPNNRPVIDGGYHLGLMVGIGKKATMPSPAPYIGVNKGMINVPTDGCKVSGFVVQNAAGEGIIVSGSNVTIEDCDTFCTYSEGILIKNTTASQTNTTVRRCKFLLSVLSLFDIGPGGCGMMVGNTNGPILIEDVEIAYSYGEGLDLDKDLNGTSTNPVVVNRVKVHDCNHTLLYFNSARWVIVKNSQFYFTTEGATIHQWDGDTSFGFKIMDETDDRQRGRDLWVYNCLFVNFGKNQWGARTTQTINTFVGSNTIVGGPNTYLEAVRFLKATDGSDMLGVFQNNIIDMTQRPSVGVSIDTGTQILHRYNNWSATPSGRTAGTGDKVGDPKLKNPGKRLVTLNYPSKSTTSYALYNTTDNFDPADYASTSESPGKDFATKLTTTINTTTIPSEPITVDFFGASRGTAPDMGATEAGGAQTNAVYSSFTASATSGVSPLEVTFTDRSTVSGLAVINSWTWDWGDATADTTTQNATHEFVGAGTYVVTLTVADTTRSLSNSSTMTITVTAGPETGEIFPAYSVSPTAVFIDEVATFTDLSTVSGAAVINSWTWAWGDGTANTTTQNATHTFATSGYKTVRLTVADTVLGISKYIEKIINVLSYTDPTDDTVVAGFTKSAASGAAPLSITFTDASSVTGDAVINKWTWDFGDGATSSAEDPTHVFNSVGVYTVTLLVEDTILALSSSTTSTVTVTTPEVPEPGNSVLFGAVRVALNTTSGSQTITSAEMGTIIPKSARFHLIKATADSVAVAGTSVSFGWAVRPASVIPDAPGQINIGNKTDTSNVFRSSSANAAKLLLDGGEFVTVTFTGWVEGGCTVNVGWLSETTAAYYLIVVFAGGVDYRAEIVSAPLGAIDTTTKLSADFAPQVVTGMSSWLPQFNSTGTDSQISIGYAHSDGTSYAYERTTRDATPVAYLSCLMPGEILRYRPVSGDMATVSVSSWLTDGVNVTVAGNNISLIAYFLLEAFGESESAVVLDYADNDGITLGWSPQYSEHILTPRIATGISTVAAGTERSGAFGVHFVTDSLEYTTSVYGENAAATRNDKSISDDDMVIYSHQGGVLGRATTAIDADGTTITWSSNNLGNYVFPGLYVEYGQATADDLIVDFRHAPSSGEAPLTVIFTDYTTGGTSWLWDFGDGETSTDQNPTHIYQEVGLYTVSLTVTNESGSGSKTEVDAILVYAASPAFTTFVVGPFKTVYTSGISAPIIHNRFDDPMAGIIELPAHTDVARSQLDLIETEDTPATPSLGIASMWVDSLTGNIKLIRSDASVGTVTVDYGTGGGEPITDELFTYVTASADDAQQDVTTGVMSLTATNVNLNSGVEYFGMVFALNVPQGATINQAYVTLKIDSTARDDADMTLYAEDTDDAGVFTTTANDISSRTPTTATVEWVATGLGNVSVNTPEIKTIVQEVVDRVGFASGNNIAILAQKNSDALFRANSFDYGSNYPVLYVNYTYTPE